ncbi:MAG: glycosyltransferase family 39 protein [Deltaproteobacteria bacterium]|nr:glycosyltransferase family 39 protein [Deltaproteobacteria bacterium]
METTLPHAPGDPTKPPIVRPPWPEAGPATRRALIAILVAVLAASIWRLVSFTLFGRFNVDEFENIQMLWLFDRGVIPYRDYLHSHTPLFNLLIWPVYRAVGAAPEVLGAVRVAILPVVLATVALVWVTARRVAGRLAALVATTLFVSSPWAVQSLGEARPDTFTLPLVFVAAWLVFRAADDPSWKPARFFGAGAILGISTLFTLKNGLYALIVAMAFEHLRFARFHAPLRRRVIDMAIFGVLIVAPYTIFVALLLATGVVRPDAVDAVVTHGLGHIDPYLMKPYHWIFITVFVAGHAFTVFGGGVGAVRARWWGEPGAIADRLVDTVSGRMLAAGLVPLLLLSFPVPHMFLMGLAFAAILAARLVVAMPRRRAALWLLAALVPPQFLTMADLADRDHQMAEFRYVLDHAPPESPVIDAVYGYGTFRPIVGRFIHYRAGILLPEDMEEQNALVLRSVLTRRYGVVLKDHLSQLQPDIVHHAIDRCYEPSKDYPERILLPRPPDDPLCPPRAKRGRVQATPNP